MTLDEINAKLKGWGYVARETPDHKVLRVGSVDGPRSEDGFMSRRVVEALCQRPSEATPTINTITN